MRLELATGIILSVICMYITFLEWQKIQIKPEPTRTVTMFTEEAQGLERTCHFLRCLYVAEDVMGMELVCSQTPATCPEEVGP